MSGSDRGERLKTLATFGYVSFVVAIGACYFWMFYDIGGSSVRYRVEQEQASQAYTKDATKEVSAECAGSDTPATCEREIEQSNREGVRNQKDLEAQSGMNKWTFWLLVISAFQFPATLAALVFVKRTLDATLEAVADTSAATKAMERQNDIAEDATKKQLRAYLAVKPMGINQLAGSPKVIGHVALQNVGHLPARNVSLFVSMRLSTGRHLDNFPVDPDTENIKRVIQPSDEMRQGSNNTIPSKDVVGGDKYLFVWGVAYYGDGYGNRRFTRFCHRYNVGSRNRSTGIGGRVLDKPLDHVYAKSVSIIDAEKARYHTYGNDAD